MRGRQMVDAGHGVIELTIGEPDVPVPTDLVTTAIDAIQSGRTQFANGQGAIGLRPALADHYITQSGRDFGPDNLLCFPGT